MADGLRGGEEKKILTSIANIPISLCFVDERYQGYRLHTDISKLENGWDGTKLLPITVVPHPEENCFAVVNGKGRCIAAAAKGIDKMCANIIMCAPKDVNERLKYEARFFIEQDDQTSILREQEKHLSRMIAGDVAAIALDKMLKKYNIGIKGIHKKKEFEARISYTEMYSIAKTYGEDCLDFIFSVACNAGWDKDSMGLIARNVRALKNMWLYADKNLIEDIGKYLSDALRETSPKVFHSKAKAKYPVRDDRIADTLYMQDMVCDALNIGKYIHVYEKNERSYIEAV